MNIILPHKIKAKPVNAWSDIKLEAKELQALVSQTFPKGIWHEALALSHAQVSKAPYSFFIVHPKMKKHFAGHDIIVNCRLIEGYDKGPFKEACMSYPFRPEKNTHRFYRALVTFGYPKRTILGWKLVYQSLELQGIAAIVAQHEIDHAAGVCVYDKFK